MNPPGVVVCLEEKALPVSLLPVAVVDSSPPLAIKDGLEEAPFCEDAESSEWGAGLPEDGRVVELDEDAEDGLCDGCVGAVVIVTRCGTVSVNVYVCERGCEQSSLGWSWIPRNV